MRSIKVRIDRDRAKEMLVSSLVMDELITENERSLVNDIKMDAGGNVLVEFLIKGLSTPSPIVVTADSTKM